MAFEGHYYIGKVARLYSYKGELYIRLYVKDPEMYLEMESMFLAIEGELVPFFIESIQFGSKGMLRIKFEDVDNEAEAKKLVKKEIFAPNSFLPKEEGEFHGHEILGFLVVDQKDGELGNVEDVIEHSSNPLIRVDQGEREILIPYQDEFIIEINSSKKRIEVDLPEGLIEMND
ncbi:MAG: ribosome maturation factor RimM [Bacteroidota bacterium]